MANYSHHFHGMERTKPRHLLYHTIARRSEISHPEIHATGQEKEGKWDYIQSLHTINARSNQSSMEDNTKGYRAIRGHHQFLG